MEETADRTQSSAFADLLPQIADERGFLIDIVLIILVLAILVMITVEIIKYILKPRFQKMILQHWEEDLFDRLARDYKVLPAPESKSKNTEKSVEMKRPERMPKDGILVLDRAVFRLPRRMFMQQVENEVQRLLLEPGREPDRVKILAAGAAPYDVAALVQWHVPDAKRSRPETETERRSEIQDHVTRAAERNVDILQLTLATGWLSRVRIASVAIGILGAQTLHFSEQGGFEPNRALLLAVIGLVAGAAASLIHDLLERLTGGNQDRY